MKIRSLCQRRIVTIDSAAMLSKAAVLMRDRHVGALVVTTDTPEGQRVAGMVTDRDLVIHVLASGLEAGAMTIGDLASESLVGVNAHDDLDAALAAMRENGVRRLLVTDDDERLVGIVSLDDLLAACASQIDGLAEVIRSGMDREVASGAAPADSPPATLRVPAVGTAGWRPAP